MCKNKSEIESEVSKSYVTIMLLGWSRLESMGVVNEISCVTQEFSGMTCMKNS